MWIFFSNEEDEASFKVSRNQFFSINIGEGRNFLATLSSNEIVFLNNSRSEKRF